MALRSTYISIFSLFLLNESQAQSGLGCFLKTCSNPGQVRINAKFDNNGNFQSGCNCACPPEVTCPSGQTLNYDARTLQGDCSCNCPANSGGTQEICRWPQVYDPSQCGCGCPSYAPDPNSCPMAQEFNPILCQCACDIGSIGGPCISNGQPVRDSKVQSDCTCDIAMVQCQGNQQPNPQTGACECPTHVNGAWLPACTPPLAKDPITCDCVATTTTLPPVGPIEVSCSSAGACSCPFGTKGRCTINCEQGNDACKDGLIECNNDGFDCIVNCRSGSACAGGAHVVGPVNGALEVNCIGSGSCEGAVIFDNEHGTDMTVKCDGDLSCKGNVHWIFGPGAGRVECNGRSGADTCSGAPQFTLIHNAETIPGSSFQCNGINCPSNAPLAFSVPGGNGGSFVTPSNPNIVTPGIGHTANPGTGTGLLPAPGVGAGGGTVIINTNPPIPVVQPPEIVICEGTGVTCKCTGNRACTIKCEEPDSCKESILDCPPGHDCTVVCMEKACTTVTINGPVSAVAAFTMNCVGLGSCVDAKVFSDQSQDVAYTCSGKDSCKGASTLNCGNGVCDVACSGEAACDGATIAVNKATSFQCSGYERCPATFTPQPVPVPTEPPTVYVPCGGMPPCPCTHTQCFTKRDPNEFCQCSCPEDVIMKEFRADPFICGQDATHQVYKSSACACDCPLGSEPVGGCLFGQSFNQNTCQCECPGGNTCPGASIMNLETCTCSCPAHAPTASDCSAVGKVLRNCQCDCPIPCAGPGQIQSPNTCACGCPYGTPTAAQCDSGIVDELACACAMPLPSKFCCLTNVPGAEQFKPWAGRCWDEQTEESCLAEPNGRCRWEPNPDLCMGNPPVNSINPNVGCLFRDVDCYDNSQCCSEVCKVDGKCR